MMIDEVLVEQEQLAIQQDALEERAAEIQLNRSEAKDRQARLAVLRGERANALDEIRRQRQTWESSARELEAAAERLESLMSRLEAERQADPVPSADGDFESRQGRLVWPVRGKLLRGFGPSMHPEFGTRILNKGFNIAAAMGSPIQCVADGTADFVDWLPGYGRCIIVNHGGGYYSLYAHASTLFATVGAEVEAGQVIGEVGDTGSLEGSQLYFEIRRGKQPLDPAQWLTPRR
jgi:septal ring factor EnvC (AmiA/AmiB activator)